MRSIKFGYKIEDGKMMIHEEEAEKIRKAFECYLAGMTMVDIGKNLGISKFHGTVRGILKCKHYLGNDIYPKIIDEDIFLKAQEIRHEKAVCRGWVGRKSKKDVIRVVKNFTFDNPQEKYKNPVKQAEYLYECIRKLTI